VIEGGVVSGAPRELGADSCENTILNVVLGSEVTEFLVNSTESVNAWHEVHHLEHGHLLNISDVAHGLELLEVTNVVREIQHEVVGVSNLKSLDLLGLVADLTNS